MSRPATDKRERLADSALHLAYENGFERTSISEIATHAGVASGSVYYYFKSKDDVGRAIVERLTERYRGAMRQWDAIPEPADRLDAFIESYVVDAGAVQQHGCPLGTVVAELAKQSPSLGRAAGAVFRDLVDWASGHFRELGYSNDTASDRALHLIAVMQGAAALSSALNSAEPIYREAARLRRWIREGDARSS